MSTHTFAPDRFNKFKIEEIVFDNRTGHFFYGVDAYALFPERDISPGPSEVYGVKVGEYESPFRNSRLVRDEMSLWNTQLRALAYLQISDGGLEVFAIEIKNYTFMNTLLEATA